MPSPTPPDTPPTEATARLPWVGGLLGFALGGFFDGILLHQVLQWHHLLSGLEGSAFRDIRVQILADGLFHLLMYAVAVAGLWRLWRARRAFALPGADRRLLAGVLIGFGVWHMLDGALSHWILGIHRIRMDVEEPLYWDLLWFFAFGVLFVAAGWRLGRGGGSGHGAPRRRAAAPAALAFAVLAAGAAAALPPPGVTTVLALFGSGPVPPGLAAALRAVDGRPVWSDPSGRLWAIDLGAEGSALPLYRHGALLVSRTILPAGCLNWMRIPDRARPSS